MVHFSAWKIEFYSLIFFALCWLTLEFVHLVPKTFCAQSTTFSNSVFSSKFNFKFNPTFSAPSLAAPRAAVVLVFSNLNLGGGERFLIDKNKFIE